MKRSIGVTIFAILFLIGGAMGLFGTLYGPKLMQSIASTEGMSPETQAQAQEAQQLMSKQSGFMLAISVASIISGIGLLMLLGWARWLTIVLAGISVAQLLVGFMGSPHWTAATLLMAVLSLAWNGLIVWFFLRPSVKAQFVSKTTNR